MAVIHRINGKYPVSQLLESGQHITGPLHVPARFALGMGCDDKGKPVSFAQTALANTCNLAAARIGVVLEPQAPQKGFGPIHPGQKQNLGRPMMFEFQLKQINLKISIGDVQLAGNTGRLWV